MINKVKAQLVPQALNVDISQHIHLGASAQKF